MDGGIGRGRESVLTGGQNVAFSLLPLPPPAFDMDAQKQLQALSEEFQQLQTGSCSPAFYSLLGITQT